MADLDKQMEGVSKGIKNLVKNLSDVNEGVAENAASIASANKQTFSGFLARSKLRKTLEKACLLYTSPSPRDRTRSRMPSSA